MATTTTRLGLRKPDRTDFIAVVIDLDNNYDLLEQTIGRIPCTSSTHPASPKTGTTIYETDTQNSLFWDGGNWRYINPTVLCTSTTRPASTSLTKGQKIHETDLGNDLVWLGAAWQHIGVPVLAATTDFKTPYYGAQFRSNATGYTYTCYDAVAPSWAKGLPWYPNMGIKVVYTPALSSPTPTVNTTATLGSSSVTDPGFAYKIWTTLTGGLSMNNAGGVSNFNAQVDSTTFGTGVMNSCVCLIENSTTIKNNFTMPYKTDNVVYTGAHTVNFVVKPTTGDISAWIGGANYAAQVVIEPVLPQ